MILYRPRTFAARRPIARTSTIAALIAATIAVGAVAQTPPATPTRIRGEIVSIGGESMVVHRTNADNVTIAFKPEVPVSAVKNVKLADIKANTYVGVASVPGADGNLTAREVLVFPEAMRGSGDGHYAWDLLPGSMMTNANVDTVVQRNSGRELTLSYKGGSKTVTVPENAPVVTFTEATRADVVAGRKVFILAGLTAPGVYEARRVVVEKDGVAPPM